MKSFIVASLIIGFAAVSQAKENTSPNAQAVDTACTQDSATAGCGAEKVGTGLRRCIHAYKKSHADFKISDGCKAAMKTMHVEKKATK